MVINKKDVSFKVDKENRTIVAYITGTQKIFMDFCYDNYAPTDSNFSLYKKKEFLMPDRFVGIAVCSPEDNWNEELGKRIAFDRLKNKVATSFFKRAHAYARFMDKEYETFLNRINSYGEKLTRCAEFRNKIITEALNECEKH